MSGSITHWIRLEPQNGGEPAESGLQDGLEALICDPLWLLTRQWQFGEFRGEDAGVPVMARARIEHAPLTGFRPGRPSGDAPIEPYDPAGTPIETLVERETARTPDKRDAANWGQHFLRLLAHAGLDRYRRRFIAAYPLAWDESEQTDAASAAYLRVMAGRTVDGASLYAALDPALRPAGTGEPDLPARPRISSEDRAEFIKTGRTWLAWVDAVHGRPAGRPSAWSDARQEYAFALSAEAEDATLVLEAEEYATGRVGWSSFDLSEGPAPDHPSRAKRLTRTLIPSPVAYKGMPASRWWEFEDAAVNFGAMEAEPTDLLRLLMIEFALVYGNDWFVLPLELEAAGAYRTRSLVVTDSFGERTIVFPYRRPPDRPAWRLFELSPGREAAPSPPSLEAPWLLLVPSVTHGIDGKPLEEVLFLRDEMANLAWAVEKRIASPTGGSIDRDEAFHARRAAEPPANREPALTPLVYRLGGDVPEHWIPLAPVAQDDQGTVRLRRARLVGRSLETPGPLGEILKPAALSLHEEEVPRAGARVTRTWRLARAPDGSTHLWIGRRKGAGSGPGYGGLLFDLAEETGVDPAGTPRRNDLQTEAAFDQARFDGADGFENDA